jgi:hypothetical protein
MKPFIIAGLMGRGLRFGLEAILVGMYGNKALDALWWILDREILIGALLIISAGITWLAYRWWSNLTVDPNIHE